MWLVIQHKDSGVPSIRIPRGDRAGALLRLDRQPARKHDADSSRLRFSPAPSAQHLERASNRERAARMIEQGLMTEQGQAVIDLAKAKGTWDQNSASGTKS